METESFAPAMSAEVQKNLLPNTPSVFVERVAEMSVFRRMVPRRCATSALLSIPKNPTFLKSEPHVEHNISYFNIIQHFVQGTRLIQYGDI